MALTSFDEAALLVGDLSAHARDLGVHDEELEAIVGLPATSWPPRSAELGIHAETRVRRLEEVLRHLPVLLGEQARDWLRAPTGGGPAPMTRLLDDDDFLVQLRDVLRSEGGI